MSIYKPCDIRGRADSELKPELYRSWGRALGYQVPAREKFVVGGDVRSSTPAFLDALMQGLCEAGADTVNLGVLPTPMVYYAKRRLGAAGCAIVTASHNPPEINGLKWIIGDCPPSADDIARLGRTSRLRPKDNHRLPSQPRTLDVSFDYVAWLQERWVEDLNAQRRVLLDPMHGCCSFRARRYLQAVFPRSLFMAIHDVPDPTFAGRAPDCSQPGCLDDLAETVYRERAHLGIAFDGDGDRIALVDDEGMTLTAEETACVLLRSMAREIKGRPFVHDVKLSDRVREVARKLGAEPVAERAGHAFIRARMIETGAPLGAEVSGHFYYADLGGGDDGLFTACRIISYLARSKRTLSKLRRACPAVYITPDLRLPLDPREREAVLQQVRKAWPVYPQSSTDGVRIDFPDGWALVRNSVTEPAMTFRFEAVDWSSLNRLVWQFCEALPDRGDALWHRFAEAMEHSAGFVP